MKNPSSSSDFLYSLIKPILFRMDPEKAHDWTLKLLSKIPQSLFGKLLYKPVQALGLTFAHPVGLAAGLDKNAEYLDALDKLGFSFIEVGTATPRAQAGNPKPRLFRLPEAEALINRMGFNNQGVDALVTHARKARYSGILGINIGKNKDTPLERAEEDYSYCLRQVYAEASYVTINISSPNTPDLRQLQQGGFFRNLLQTLQQEREKLVQQYQKMTPLLIKVSPDEEEETLKNIVASVLDLQFDGIIATNTTCARNTVNHLPYGQESGGLSGKPVEEASLKTLELLKKEAGNAITLIGAGGIDSLETAQDKLNAGADLIQIYTGLIYKGPGLVKEIVSGIK